MGNKWWKRRMGFARDQQGILHRYFREEQTWRTHLQNTKELICEHIEELPSKKSVLVLGSGWLLDVPIDKLLESFETVYLVDIHHPVEIRNKYRRVSNIQWIEMDLTGVSETLFRLCRKRSKNFYSELKKVKIAPPSFSIQADFVISVNILSQLDELLVQYINKHHEIDNDTVQNFRTKIQEKHVRFVKKHDGLLITDTEEVYYDRDMVPKGEEFIIYTALPESNLAGNWQWLFDTKMTYQRERVTYRNVKAYSFNKAHK